MGSTRTTAQQERAEWQKEFNARQRELNDRNARQRELDNLQVRIGQQELAHHAHVRQQQWQATLDAEMKRREPIMRALETLINPPPEPE